MSRNKQIEYKTGHGFVTNVSEDEGIVTALFSVFGVTDSGLDRIWPGSFSKTFSERGHKILILDQHRTDSIGSVIAKPMKLRELSKEELPSELLTNYPDATGAAEVTAQFDLEDDISLGAWRRIKKNWITEWSFGYDALDYDFTDETKDGEPITVRNLRTVKLYEISPVLWGMNDATVTTGAKADDAVAKEPDEKVEEEKPWDIFSEDDMFCVYKVDEDGNKIEEALHCYDNREEAVDYMQALYANVEDAELEDEKDDTEKQDGPDVCICPECDYEVEKEQGVPCRSIACPECEAMLVAEVEETGKEADQEDDTEKSIIPDNELIDQVVKAGRILAQRNANRLVSALTTILEILEDAGIDVPGYEREPVMEEPKTAPEGAATTDKQAGPETPTSKQLLVNIQKNLVEIDMEA